MTTSADAKPPMSRVTMFFLAALVLSLGLLLTIAGYKMISPGDPFAEAFAKDDLGAMAELLRRDNTVANVRWNNRPFVVWAAEEGRLPALLLILDKSSGIPRYDRDTALLAAVDKGQVEATEIMIKRDADLDRALVMAVDRGREKIAKMLLDAGASPDARDGLALVVAVEKERPEMVRLLLDRGADPSLHGDAAAKIAEEKKNQEILGMLRGAAKKAKS
jgi:hypothetical protein